MFTKSLFITVLSAAHTARYTLAKGRLDLKRFYTYILVPVWSTIMEVYGAPIERTYDLVAPDVIRTAREVQQDIECYVKRLEEPAEPAEPQEPELTHEDLVDYANQLLDPLREQMENPELPKPLRGRPKGSKDSRPRKYKTVTA